jgi:hypothetical protein
MRTSIVCLGLASAAVSATMAMPMNPAAAEFKQIGHISKDGLRAKCGAASGEFHAAKSGEYWCDKGNNIVDCNYKGVCIGGTPRVSGSGGVGAGGGYAAAQRLAKASASFVRTFERKRL